MFVDAATLQDLDVIPTPGRRGTTLWNLVDRTRTRTGARALRQRLLSPARTADEIVALQLAQQALAADVACRSLIVGAELDGVERYLATTWQLPAAMPALARLRPWYRHYRKDVDEGRRCVTALVNAAVGLASRLRASNPAILRAMGDELSRRGDALAAGHAGELASKAAALTFDQAARGDAVSVLGELVRTFGSVEALWSLGAATLEHGWHHPVPSVAFRATGLVHPFLGPTAIPNDLWFNETVRVCLVTGPNMAGKSTFLKAVSLAVLLAHLGSGVPAAAMEFPVVATLFSSGDVHGSLDARESDYLAEVGRIAALAAALREHGSAFAVIDEPFRGTNVHDATDATLAVISRLADHSTAIVFVASHLGELALALADDPRIGFVRFEADVSEDAPRFDYRLREGVSTQRLGMTLLRQSGVLDMLGRQPEMEGTPPGSGPDHRPSPT
jgi:DNA mismatch repair protein MutS